MKTYTLEELTDKHIGKKGTKKRDEFERELHLDLLQHTKKEHFNKITDMGKENLC